MCLLAAVGAVAGVFYYTAVCNYSLTRLPVCLISFMQLNALSVVLAKVALLPVVEGAIAPPGMLLRTSSVDQHVLPAMLGGLADPKQRVQLAALGCVLALLRRVRVGDNQLTGTPHRAEDKAAGGALLLLLLPYKEQLLAALQRTSDDTGTDAGNETVLGPSLQLHASQALALMREWP